MRSDMFEVIIERPRTGGGRGMTKGRRAEPLRQHEAPIWEPVSRGRGTKCLNENLAPLRRFLASRVGRPWDAVRSEISARLTMRSAVHKHVLDHVKDMVEENAVLIDGRPYHHPGGYYPYGGLIVAAGWRGFYVCPKTGALRLASERWKRPHRPEADPDVRRIDDLRQARRIEGVWYLVTFAPVPGLHSERAACRDVVIGASLDTPGMLDYSGRLKKTHGRADRYAAEKRQLSTREIRVYAGR
jgi:hypothetical protein